MPSSKILPRGGESSSCGSEKQQKPRRGVHGECTLTRSRKKELCHFPSPLPHPSPEEEEEERGVVVSESCCDPISLTIASSGREEGESCSSDRRGSFATSRADFKHSKETAPVSVGSPTLKNLEKLGRVVGSLFLSWPRSSAWHSGAFARENKISSCLQPNETRLLNKLVKLNTFVVTGTAKVFPKWGANLYSQQGRRAQLPV